MSPSRESGGGTRTPLRIHRDSHHIRKSHSPPPPCTFSNAISSTSSSSSNNNNHQPQQQQQQQPVVIYAQSPKIIHTQARDFMALVQKLTGMSPSGDDRASEPAPPPLQGGHAVPSDCGGSAELDPPSDLSPQDVPLFTPGPRDSYCGRSPRINYSVDAWAPPSHHL